MEGQNDYFDNGLHPEFLEERPCGIIYDLDGVIVLSEEMHKKAFDITMAQLGISSSDLDWSNKCVGKGNIYIMSNTFNIFNIKEDVHVWVLKWVNNYQKLIKENGPVVVPGFIEFNKKIPFKKVIATCGLRENAVLILDYLQMDIPIISIEDITYPKPSPEIFVKAAKAIGIDSRDCIVFEDSLFGVRAGILAGMKVVALTTTHTREELEAENPTHIINNFNGILINKHSLCSI